MDRRILLTCLGMLISLSSFAQGFQFQPDVYIQRVSSASIAGNPNKPNNSYSDTLGLTYIQDKWSDMVANPGTYQNNYEFKNVTDYVKVGINFDTGVIVPNYYYGVSITILKYNASNPSVPFGTQTANLFLYRDSASNTANLDLGVFKFNNVHAFRVIINDIGDLSNSGATVLRSNLAKNFYIETGVPVQRYDKVSPFYIHSFSTSDGNFLNLQWWVDNSSTTSCSAPFVLPEFKPADYELEWTYVDNYQFNVSTGASQQLFSSSTGTIAYNFKNNSTRIRLTGPGSTFKIPLVYERGAIVYRIRAVRPGNSASNYQGLVYSAWTLPDAGTLSPTQSCFNGSGYVISNAHANDLNWQYTISFAEDGKYKHVINYFDGTYRNRQTQTKINSDDNYVIAIDKIYDYEGRPAIETLPTPLQQTYLGFRTDISLTQTGQYYNASLFDHLGCSLPEVLPAFNSSSKANIYYSSLNPDKSGVQKFVPDAKGYPFIQTTLSPEKSARVLWQGGAGLDHQLWTTHATRFEYMRALQPELDDMFGSQSWSSEYFTKRVATDPNGQVSFDITNYKGQLVASGLLGDVDTVSRPLSRIPDYVTGTYSCFDVLKNSNQNRLWNGWSVDIPFYNDKGGLHYATYRMKVPAYSPSCQGKKISAVGAFVYSINDDCGAPYLDSTSGTLTVNSDSSATVYKSVPANLPKGKFAAQKTLTFSRYALYDKARAFIVANEPACYKDLNYFVKKAVEQADGDFPCIKAEELGPCEMRKRQLIREMYPDGKYGRYPKLENGAFKDVINDNSLPVTDPDAAVNSIFSPITKSSVYIDPNNPMPQDPVLDIYYRYRDACISYPTSVTRNGRTYTNIKNLPVDTFIMIFNDQMAEALLPLHPEYCKLALCDDGTFAEQMEALETYKEARRVNKFDLDAIVKSDPLFYNAQPNDTASMRTRLSYFKNLGNKRIDKLALEQAYCGAGNTEEALHCAKYLYSTQIQSFTFIDSNIRQKYFELLKGYYLSNRMLVLQRLLDSTDNTCSPCMDNSGAPPSGVAGWSWYLSPNKRLETAKVEDRVFATIFAPNSTQLDTSVHLPDWAVSAINNANDPSYVTTSTSAPVDVMTVVTENNQSICDGQIDAIMAKLQNCSASSTVLTQIKTNLTNYCTSSGGGLTNLTPDQIKNAIITGTGLTLTDLCHPFLTELNIYADKENAEAFYECGAQEQYTGLKNLLNRAEVINAIKSATIAGSSSASFNLSSSNKYENQIAAKLSVATGGQVNIVGQLDTIIATGPTIVNYVKLKIYASGTDTVKLFLKPKQSGGADLQGATSVIVNDVSCLNDDRQSTVDGYVAKTTAVINLTVNGGSPSLYYLWSNALNMMQQPVSGSLNGCLTCIDIKEAMKQFKTDKAVYGYDDGVNHPLAENTIANYLNFKLNKRYTYSDYYQLMEGCSISDSVFLPYHTGTITAAFSSDAAANNFLTNWKSFTKRDLISGRIKYSSSNVKLILDFADLPQDSLKAYKDACSTRVSSNSGTFAYLPNDVLTVFVPSNCTASSFLTNTSLFTSSSVNAEYNGSYGSYTMYQRTGSAGAQYVQANNWDGARSFANNCPSAFVMYEGALLRSADYSNAQKQSLLTYIYSLNNNSKAEILDSLAPANISERISGLSGKGLSYIDPFCDNRMANLYAYDKVQSSHAGFQVVTKILDTVKAALGSRKIFPNAGTYTVSGRMKVYRKLNRVFWYRYFDNANKLYNIHIEMPRNTTDSMAAALQLDSVHVGPTSGSSTYRFTAYVSYSGTNEPIACRGYADFAVGTGTRLDNVVLLEKQGNKYCIDSVDCEYTLLKDAKVRGKVWYDWNLDSTSNAMTDDMIAYFVNNAVDTLNICMEQQKYHVTLNYYDLVGNLEKTIPPSGAAKATTYEYNSLNQLVKKVTPDEGATNYFYDGAGRLIFSQNSRQAPESKYSYIIYDKLSRVVETGEVKLGCSGNSTTTSSSCTYSVNGQTISSPHPIYVAYAYKDIYPVDTIVKYIRSKSRYDVVATVYDTVQVDLGSLSGQHLSAQENIRNKVSAIYFYSSLNNSSIGYALPSPDFGTHYSYDLLGNVKTVTYDCPAFSHIRQQYKRVDYDYDQISGKVNMLTYNRSKRDQYYQKYEYDADNRLTTVYTSNDGLIWNKDARYEYYKHGPLATAKVGDLKIQSMDFAYTIQGWLKSVNGDVRTPDKDMGQNGQTGDLSYARDAMSHTLDYFAGDYSPIGSQQVTYLANPSLKLYNGNIVRQTTSMQNAGSLQRDYRYDQLHRLIKATYAVVNESALTVGLSSNIYMNTYSYDPDGNIQTLQRYDQNGSLMDNLSYAYKANTNRLHKVTDQAGRTGYDIGPGQTDSNYKYDNTGNLVLDRQEHQKITWNAYGKVSSITDTVTGVTIYYYYDGNGNRYKKDVVTKIDADNAIHHGIYYVRDAAGNILAAYDLAAKHSPISLIRETNTDLYVRGEFTKFIMRNFMILGGFIDNLSGKIVAQDAGWAAQATDKPISFYFNNAPDMYNLVLYTDDSYLNELIAYDTDNNTEIFAKGFYAKQDLAANMVNAVLSAPNSSKKLLQHFESNMAQADVADLYDHYSVAYTEGLPEDNAQAMSDYITQNNAQALVGTSIMSVLAKATTTEAQAKGFYTAVMHDNDIYNEPQLRQPSSVFTQAAADVLYAADDRADIYTYFDTWGGSAGWLEANTAMTDRLHIVLNADQEEVLTDFFSTPSAQIVDEAIAELPGMTGMRYLDLLQRDPNMDGTTIVRSYTVGVTADTMTLAEHHLYGINRLGVQRYDHAQLLQRNTYNADNSVGQMDTLNLLRPWYSNIYGELIKKDQKTIYGNGDVDPYYVRRWIGYKHLELTDHLGNVLVTVRDRKTGHVPGGSPLSYDYWVADVYSSQDYYPFGMAMPSRHLYNWPNYYRFGYNGQMKEENMTADGVHGTHNTAMFWEYDTRLARRWNVDPVDQRSISGYSVMENNPIWKSDPLGDDPDNYYFNREGEKVDFVKNDQPDKFFVEDKNGSVEQNNNTYSEIDINSETGHLARIIFAEAGGENQLSKESVGDVMKNRVESNRYPDTYQDVAEQSVTTKSGIRIYQFSSVNPDDKSSWRYHTPLSGPQGKPLVQAERSQFANSIGVAIKIVNFGSGITNGAILYYSPKSMIPKGSQPRTWDFSKLKETTPDGVSLSSFRFFKYK